MKRSTSVTACLLILLTLLTGCDTTAPNNNTKHQTCILVVFCNEDQADTQGVQATQVALRSTQTALTAQATQIALQATQTTLTAQATVAALQATQTALATGPNLQPTPSVSVPDTPSSGPLIEGTPDQTGHGVTKFYIATLRQDEVITGDTYQLVAQGHTWTSCVAYLISGPGSISYTLTDGQSLRYSGVTNQDQANQLLQARIDYLRQSPQTACSARVIHLQAG